jgi:general secretion pathway protein B
MSYILEALKKADQEHELGAVPDLATPHEAEHPQTRSYRWPWIVVALLSVNAVLVAMLLKGKDAEVPVTAQVPPERQTALINDQLVQPIQQTSEALISEAPTPEKPVLPEPVLRENKPVLTTGQVVVLPEATYSQDSEISILPEEQSDTRMDAMTTAKGNSQLQNWYELPQEIRNQLDLPRLDVHVYSEQPQRRYILVNLEKYREGEILASGLVLEEILPDGMVMSYQGERFRVEK